MSKERTAKVMSGWIMLPVVIVMLLGGPALFIAGIVIGVTAGGSDAPPIWWMFITGMLVFMASFFIMPGFFTLQPNEARVLILFGKYRGTVRDDGFHWGNPFYANGASAEGMQIAASATGFTLKKADGSDGSTAPKPKAARNKISLRARTLNGEKLKVNDKGGNPVEIAAVVVWRVNDTAQAMFDVDNYETYVSTQSETALRHVATAYAYDHGEEDDAGPAEITLRSNIEEVSEALQAELAVRLAKAGVVIDDARLTHLAYAPEIAQAMLRRQQAEAVIAARRKIVHGAVSMVEMALTELAEKNVVSLDDERKAAMVSNLMVVLCGEAEVHPVVNAGTLYQ
ncbi:MAG: SPFH domain-containing protein [Coriobacteriia bacterium]|nr:SPFH domain-containing protein [Coriobacteriia bacterium]